LGEILREDGDAEGALTLLKEALEIRYEGLGPQHPDSIESAKHTAAVYVHQQSFEKAESLLVGAYRAALDSLGNEHQTTLALHAQYDELCRAWGKPSRIGELSKVEEREVRPRHEASRVAEE